MVFLYTASIADVTASISSLFEGKTSERGERKTNAHLTQQSVIAREIESLSKYEIKADEVSAGPRHGVRENGDGSGARRSERIHHRTSRPAGNTSGRGGEKKKKEKYEG